METNLVCRNKKICWSVCFFNNASWRQAHAWTNCLSRLRWCKNKLL